MAGVEQIERDGGTMAWLDLTLAGGGSDGWGLFVTSCLYASASSYASASFTARPATSTAQSWALETMATRGGSAGNAAATRPPGTPVSAMATFAAHQMRDAVAEALKDAWMLSLRLSSYAYDCPLV